MFKSTLYVIFLGLFLCFNCSCQTNELTVEKTTEKENFYLYLLIGQSNMAGRGIVEAQDIVTNSRILMLNSKNEWEIAKEPLHFDKPKVAGVGPGLSFARAILDTLPANVKIGLIPCACGGSPIRVWEPGAYWTQTTSYPYDDAVKRTKLALEKGVLKGILWHQGSSDNTPTAIAAYKTNLMQLITSLRKEFNVSEVPFIVGELGRLANNHVAIDSIFHQIKAEISNYDVVSASGVTYNPDSVHFDSKSQRIMGKRYAEKMKKLMK